MAADCPIPGVVHLPRWFRTLGLWGGGICLVPALSLFWILPGFALFWAVLASCFGGLILARRNWCVLYDEDGFETVSVLGISRRYGYREVCGIRDKRLYLHQQEKVRVLAIPVGAVGRMEFLNHANREYRKCHENRPIPMVQKAKKQNLFLGNVAKPGRYILKYCLVLLPLGALLFTSIAATVPLSPENTDYSQLTFTGFRNRYYMDAGLWFESSAGGKFYHKGWAESMDAVIDLCDGQTEFEIYSIRTHTGRRDGPSRNTICSITGPDGTEYLTFEQTNAYRADCRKQYLWMTSPLLALGLVYIGVSVYVGRHPERFNPKTVYRFFKKNTIIWKGCFKDGTN